MGPIRRLVIGALVGMLLAGCFGSAPSPTGTPSDTPSATLTAGPSDSTSPTASETPSATESPTRTPTTAPTPTTRPSPTPSPSATAFLTYTVRAGDTLGSIAAAHDTTWQSLVYWNRDRYPSLDPASAAYNPNVIETGWTLRLQRDVVIAYDPPPPPVPTAAPTPKPTATSATPATGTAVSNGSRSSNRV
ncbi:MAG TPA: LysM domain-containing protein, partial [Candidatus Angelobacter sp.]|nr:LysM domain-containing protein [Candidatus Angelobacter sp.]